MWASILTWLQYNKILTWLSSPIKIVAVCLMDVLNRIYDPFKDLTRAVDPKYAELLFVKAKRFENDLLQNFLLYGTVWNYRKPLDGSVDTGDQALHHGIATAYWAIKYSITKDSDDLLAFNNSVIGLHLHQTIHGESIPRLIRGFRLMTAQEKALYTTPTSWTAGDQKFFTKDQLIIEDATSNDTASGHFFGIYHAWKYGTPEIKLQCQDLIRGLANELLDNSNSLINADGSPTMYGKLAQGVISDPLRLSLCLAIFKAASVITGESVYEEHYKQLRGLYSRWVIYPKIKLWWWDNDNDSPRAAMQLYILTELETDTKWHGLYVKGLRRVWRVVHKTSNAFVSFLNLAAKLQYNNEDRIDIQKGKDRLSEFSFEDRKFDTQKINSTDTVYLSSQDIKLFQWKGHLRSSQPLPIWKLGNQDDFWQRNLNSVDNWVGQLQPSQQFSGVDYLIAYILGRKIGLFTDKD